MRSKWAEQYAVQPVTLLADADTPQLAASTSGSVYSNANYTGRREVILPGAVVGMQYTFIRESTTCGIKITPTSPNQIYDGRVRGYYFWEMKTPGVVTLKCHRNGEWVIHTKTGEGRHPYYENETYYVDPSTGSDSNSGLVGSPVQTLVKAFKLLNPGDMLVLENGTYSGDSNNVTQDTLPRGLPSYEKTPVQITDASRQNYWITVKARNFGSVVITSSLILNAGGYEGDPSCIEDLKFYVQFDGIIWNKLESKTIGGQYLKFFRCGFRGAPASGNVQTVAVSGGNVYYRGAKNILFEDCFAWGPGGRYKFITWNAENVIFRRCIARSDTTGWSEPGSGLGSADFIAYDSVGVEFQNCISLDSQAPPAGNQGWYGCFLANNNYLLTERISMRGCIVINGPGNGFVSTGLTTDTIDSKPSDQANVTRRQRPRNILFEHCFASRVGDPTGGGYGFFIIAGTDLIVRNCTVANMVNSGYGFYADYPRHCRGTRIEDCVFASVSGTNYSSAGGWLTPVALASYSGGPAVADALAAGLKYPTRLEASSTLEVAGQGATILKRIGSTGTLYGDPGSMSTGDAFGLADDLWPWPNEAIIKTAMSAAGGFGDSNRGWTSGGLTLSQYIWRELGAVSDPL